MVKSRTELMRNINDMMTFSGCSLTEKQDAALAAALAILLPSYVEHEMNRLAAASTKILQGKGD